MLLGAVRYVRHTIVLTVNSDIDVEGNNHYKFVLNARGGDESTMGDVMRELQLKARDHGRLPMQWNDSPNAGFTDAHATPWMTINGDYVDWNVASQVDDPASILAFWRHMLALRKKYTDLFVYGSYKPILESQTGESVLGFERESTEQQAVVLLNFSDKEQKVPMAGYKDFRVLVSNQDAGIENDSISLKPFGAVVLLRKEQQQRAGV